MKTLKRFLAMSLALALLLSFSPTMGVNAAEEDTSAYNQLMHDYKLNNDLSSVSYSTNASAGGYIAEDENGYLKFGNMETYKSSCYTDMKHGLTGATKLVFEAEFCCSTPGFVINIRANNYNSKTVDLIKVEANQLTFMGTQSKMVILSEGEWYKITVACDLDNHTYDAFVNEERLVDDGKTANQLTTLTRIRAQINDATIAGGEFLIRDIKWYTPDETAACPDENKDHICDYGCSEPVGECGDTDGDELCDYGCGKVYSPYNDLMHYSKLTRFDENFETGDLLTLNASSVADIISFGENIKFENKEGKATPSTYIQVYPGFSSNKFVFEADFCVNKAGMTIVITGNSSKKAMQLNSDGTLVFMGASGNKSVTLTEGQWYTITFAYDFITNTYDAFVDGKQVAFDLASNFTSFTRFRIAVENNSATGEFLIDNVKWYTHYHEYTVVESAIVDENGNAVADNVITASGVLNMNGYDATIKVTGENTVLSVVDTAFMDSWDLSGNTAGKLTLKDGSTGKIENWTQYGEYKYLAVYDKESGTYSAHPFNLTIDKCGINTSFPAVSLRATFIADDVVAKLINAGEFGLHNHTADADGEVEFTRYDKKAFVTENGVINGIQAYFYLEGSLGKTVLENDKTNTFGAYIKLDAGNGEIVIDSLTQPTISPKQILEKLNTMADDFSADLQTKVAEMLAKDENAHLKDYLANFVPTEE